MTQQQRFFRKILYIMIIAILIVPLYIMGNPAQRNQNGTLTQGGKLARMRNDAGLAEVNLGEIDPASSTMKLATFGMRGVAIALLWNRSLEYEKRADWNSVVATGNQIIMLEPHFITIWDFVGWKLAYNASAQFDDYRERYRWVIRGFDFLQKGTTFNQTDPRLFSKAGWTISQKIGIADEKNQYRRLFREDEDFHSRQTYKERDNWLFGRNYYQMAESLYEKGGSIGKETRLIFYSRSRMNLIRYAEWMEMDGCGVNKTNTPIFDVDHAAAAWKTAEEYWKDFSKMTVRTTIEDQKKPGEYRTTSLVLADQANAEIEALTQKIEAMLPKGMNRKSIAWDRWNNELNDEQRASLLPKLLDPAPANHYSLGEVDEPYRIIREYLDGKHGKQPKWENWRDKLAKSRDSFFNEDQRKINAIPSILRSETDNLKLRTTEMNLGEWQFQAYDLIRVTPEVLADKVQGEKQLEARDICDEITRLREEHRFSSMFRDILDYRRHTRRVVVEQQEEARMGRDYRHQVSLRYRAAQHEEANQAFLKSMESWKKLTERPEFKDIPLMPQFESDFLNEVEKYVLVLDQLEQVFPEKFPFQDFLRNSDSVQHFYNNIKEANQWIEKLIADKNYVAAKDAAEKAMMNGSGFTSGDEVQALAPVPEIRDEILKSCKLYVQAWEKIGGAKFDEAQKIGTFENYALKTYLELMVNKADKEYRELMKEETLAVTEPEKALDHLNIVMNLWGKILEKYPVVKYDRNSEIRNRIQRTVHAWVLEKKKKNEEIPKEFPLRSFM